MIDKGRVRFKTYTKFDYIFWNGDNFGDVSRFLYNYGFTFYGDGNMEITSDDDPFKVKKFPKDTYLVRVENEIVTPFTKESFERLFEKCE